MKKEIIKLFCFVLIKIKHQLHNTNSNIINILYQGEYTLDACNVSNFTHLSDWFLFILSLSLSFSVKSSSLDANWMLSKNLKKGK